MLQMQGIFGTVVYVAKWVFKWCSNNLYIILCVLYYETMTVKFEFRWNAIAKYIFDEETDMNTLEINGKSIQGV